MMDGSRINDNVLLIHFVVRLLKYPSNCEYALISTDKSKCDRNNFFVILLVSSLPHACTHD